MRLSGVKNTKWTLFINSAKLYIFVTIDIFIANIMKNASEQSKAAALPALLDCSAEEWYRLKSEEQLDPFEAFSGKEQAKELYSREYSSLFKIFARYRIFVS